MKSSRNHMSYEAASDVDILHAYIHKNANYKRSDARKIKRTLRKLMVNS